MEIVSTANELKQLIIAEKKFDKKIGFVPTMGALHTGHLSLIKKSKEENDITVCSIFVNPTQFNDAKDYEKYPITLDTDSKLLSSIGCDVLFVPQVREIYPDGTELKQPYSLGYFENILEGKFRPGHYQGVCQVVDRLLEITEPNVLYLGQKDYQQYMVLKKLIQLKNWNDKIKISLQPTMREQSGLAMSSRNTRLSDGDKKNATILSQILFYIKENIAQQNIPSLIKDAKQQIINNGFESIDYLEIVNAETLSPISNYNVSIKTIALVAATINEVRLIDNIFLN